jgi:hypothetical protein
MITCIVRIGKKLDVEYQESHVLYTVRHSGPRDCNENVSLSA